MIFASTHRLTLRLHAGRTEDLDPVSQRDARHLLDLVAGRRPGAGGTVVACAGRDTASTKPSKSPGEVISSQRAPWAETTR
jgi:hypothetical protein